MLHRLVCVQHVVPLFPARGEVLPDQAPCRSGMLLEKGETGKPKAWPRAPRKLCFGSLQEELANRLGSLQQAEYRRRSDLAAEWDARSLLAGGLEDEVKKVRVQRPGRVRGSCKGRGEGSYILWCANKVG